MTRTLDARGPTPSRDPLARVVQRLGPANVLLVLDGCEPVIEEAARVAAGVLAECPGVRVLATSREVLHLEGEVRVAVAPLAVPAVGADACEVAASESVRLFVERARASGRAAADRDRLALVAEICRRLDGLPLRSAAAAASASWGCARSVSARESECAVCQARDRRPSRSDTAHGGPGHDQLHTTKVAAAPAGGVPRRVPFGVLATAVAAGSMPLGRRAAGRDGGTSISRRRPRWWSALRPARHRPRYVVEQLARPAA